MIEFLVASLLGGVISAIAFMLTLIFIIKKILPETEDYYDD